METFEHKGETYFTGMIPAESKAKRVKCHYGLPAEVAALSRREVYDLIQAKSRLPRRELVGTDTVYNQGQIGSCCGQAGASAFEAASVLAGIDWEKKSGEYIYQAINKDSRGRNQDRGAMLDDCMNQLLNGGVAKWMKRHQFKWKSSDFTPEDHASAMQNRAFEAYGVDTFEDLVYGMAMPNMSAVIAYHFSNASFDLDRNGIIKRVTPGVGNHAENAIDVEIIDGEPALIVKNSHGKNYGDGGFAKMQKRHLVQPMKNHYFFLIRSVIANKSDDSPEPQRV